MVSKAGAARAPAWPWIESVTGAHRRHLDLVYITALSARCLEKNSR